MIVIGILILVGVVANILISLVKKTHSQFDSSQIESTIKSELERLGSAIKTDNSNNKNEINTVLTGIKTELSQSLKDNRTELNENLDKFRTSIETKIGEFSTTLKDTSDNILRKQNEIRTETETKLDVFQKSMNDSIKSLNEGLQTQLKGFSEQQKKDSENTINKQEAIRKETESKLEALKETMSTSIADLSNKINDELTKFGNSQNTNAEASTKKQTEIRQETEKKLQEFSVAMNNALDSLSQSLTNRLNEFGEIQKSNSEDYIKKHDDIKTATESKLDKIKETVETQLNNLRVDNGKKLDEMRNTVDQKLQEALDKKLSESFNLVSQQLKDVHAGLGEMKTLANGVGDLKKVLTNVKTRGMIGEIQLGNLLASVLSPEQYDTNVVVKKGTQERVEFAIKLPGRDEENSLVYLPIDSKFPDAAYQKLILAYDEADAVKIKIAQKELENAIKISAKDMRTKYINPPETTDFAILFLPFEGLYAEVLQNTNLVHTLQNEFHITVVGPTTLGAFINSLQMGFKTLAIQKRSSEVWNLLGAVKTQFNMFGTVLVKAQDKIRGAGEDIEKLVGTRTRMIQSKLKQVEQLPDHKSQETLEINIDEEELEKL